MGEKIMKKLLMLAVLFGLVACSTANQKKGSENASKNTNSAVDKIKKKDGYCSPLDKATGGCGKKK
jgi:starvation-inducible outer membrane lipoprotein